MKRIAIGAVAIVLVSACGGQVRCPTPTACTPHHSAPSPPPTATPPPGSVPMVVAGLVAMGEGAALVLSDREGQHRVPIFIGADIAQVIAFRVRGERFPRPLTHDLLDSMIERLGGHVVMIHIDKIRDQIFVGSVHVWDGRRMHRLDARSSDAAAIAVGHRLPIYVSPAVIASAGEAPDLL